MTKPVSLPAIFSGIKSRKDKTFRLEFDTQELAGQDAATLLNLHQSFCALLIAPTEQDLESAEIPDFKPEGNSKTPAQRLRGVVWHYWNQQGGADVLGDFDLYYSRAMEVYINRVKARLDGGES